MTTKTGVQVIGKLFIFVFITYLVALGIYAGTHGLQPMDKISKENISDPANETRSGDPDPMVFCIEAMSTYYMGLGISDEDILVKAIVSVIVCIFGIFVNLVLLNGSGKKRSGNILPWLILTMFHLVLDMFVRVSLIVISYYDPKGWILVQESIGSGVLMYIFGAKSI